MERHQYRVVFHERPSEVFRASRFEDYGAIIEFYDADIEEDETTGTRVFTRSSVVEVVQLDD